MEIELPEYHQKIVEKLKDKFGDEISVIKHALVMLELEEEKREKEKRELVDRVYHVFVSYPSVFREVMKRVAENKHLKKEALKILGDKDVHKN